MSQRILSAILIACCSFSVVAAGANEPVTLSVKTAGMTKLDGFLPLYWDTAAGKMWMEISRFDQEFLYLVALSAGVGSNDLGLDRGRMDESKAKWLHSSVSVRVFC